MKLIPNNKGIYQLLQDQKDMQQLLDIERDAEERFLYILTLNDKDVAVSDVGKERSRSITAQIRRWKDTLKEEERNSNFTFVGLNNSYKSLKNYILDKYSGKKKREWESLFAEPDFERDVRRLLISKIYQHKMELTIRGEDAFLSGKAHNEVQFLEALKRGRNFAHEAVNRVKKLLDSQPFNERTKQTVIYLLQETFDNNFGRYLPDREARQMNHFRNYNRFMTGL